MAISYIDGVNDPWCWAGRSMLSVDDTNDQFSDKCMMV